MSQNFNCYQILRCTQTFLCRKITLSLFKKKIKKGKLKFIVNIFCFQNFDRYRASKMVMDCLFIFDDPSMTRMCVAICSILAAKISTEQTTMLGTKRNMQVSITGWAVEFDCLFVCLFCLMPPPEAICFLVFHPSVHHMSVRTRFLKLVRRTGMKLGGWGDAPGVMVWVCRKICCDFYFVI